MFHPQIAQIYTDSLSELDVERSSFAFATARQVDACHAEAFGVGGFGRGPLDLSPVRA